MMNRNQPNRFIRKATAGKPSSGKTKRGATHEQNRVFLARQILPKTPAQYRRQHLGRTKHES